MTKAHLAQVKEWAYLGMTLCWWEPAESSTALAPWAGWGLACGSWAPGGFVWRWGRGPGAMCWVSSTRAVEAAVGQGLCRAQGSFSMNFTPLAQLHPCPERLQHVCVCLALTASSAS